MKRPCHCDLLVETYADSIIQKVMNDVKDEDITVQVTILVFEKLSHYLESHRCPRNVEHWLMKESKRLIS